MRVSKCGARCAAKGNQSARGQGARHQDEGWARSTRSNAVAVPSREMTLRRFFSSCASTIAAAPCAASRCGDRSVVASLPGVPELHSSLAQAGRDRDRDRDRDGRSARSFPAEPPDPVARSREQGDPDPSVLERGGGRARTAVLPRGVQLHRCPLVLVPNAPGDAVQQWQHRRRDRGIQCGVLPAFSRQPCMSASYPSGLSDEE